MAASPISSYAHTLRPEAPPAPPAERGAARRADQAGEASPRSLVAQQTAETRGLILKASLEVSITTGDQAQQLIFRTAIDKLNEILKPELGEDAIQNASNQDNSPEGTAGRILAFATGLFDLFAAQRPGMDPAQIRKEFGEVIGRGIDQGLKEARDILKGLNVLQGSIAENVDKTETLVKQGLAAFLDDKAKAADSTGTATNAAT